MPIQMELVLNVDYGGFSFNTEMALWLSENRGWTVLSEKKYNHKEKYIKVFVFVIVIYPCLIILLYFADLAICWISSMIKIHCV